MGTPEKIIKFITEGHFYLLFVFIEYDATVDGKVQFKKFDDGKYVHCQFLDIICLNFSRPNLSAVSISFSSR